MKKALLFFLIIFSFLYGNKIIEVQNCYSSWWGTSCNDCINNYYKAEKTIKDALNDVTDDNGAEIVICKRTDFWGNIEPYYEDNLKIKHSNIYIHSDTNNPKDVVIEGDNNHIFKNTNWINNLKIENLTLDVEKSKKKAISNKRGGSGWILKNLIIKSKGYGIYNNKALQNSIIEDVNITSENIAIKLKNASNILIKNINIDSNDYILYSTNAKGEINITSDNGDVLKGKYGIYFKNGIQNYFINNYKIGTTEDNSAPISLNKANNLIIKNCDLNSSDKGSGVYIKSVNSLDFENNYIHNIKYEGLYANIIKNKSKIISNIFEGGNYGIYLSNVYKQVDILNNNIENIQSAGIYLDKINDKVYIEKNIINGKEAGIYIKNLSKKSYIKSNIIKNASNDSGLHLLTSDENIGNEVLYNCFINNKYYQTYNKDEGAIFDDGEKGNYWSDWSGSGSYIITKYGRDNHPLSSCNLFLYQPQLDYRMDECSWDDDSNIYEIKNYGILGNKYNATALNDANVTTGKICNGGDIISSTNKDKAIKLKNDYPLPLNYTLNVWIKFPLNTNGHKIFWNGTTRVKYFNIADRRGSDYDFIYFTQYISNKSWTLNVMDDTGGDYYIFNPQNLKGWHMLTFVVNNNKTDFYLDGEKKHSFSTHPNNKYLGLLFNSDFDGNADEPNGQSIGADVDEFELYSSDLSNDDILKLYNNENSSKNYDRTIRNCPICTQTQQNYSFNAVSKIIYHNATQDWDNNLTTQIINKPFDLYVLSKNKDTNISQEANITKVRFDFYSNGDENQCSGNPYSNEIICDDSTSNKCSDTNSSGEAEIKNIKINRAIKCLKVYIEGKELNFTGALVQEANSTDNFAIRPQNFAITNIPSKIKAGSEFNLTIQALDYDNNPSKDYNESLTMRGNSPELNWTEKNINCITGDLDKTNGGNFKNGETNATFTYNEVGDLNITVKEIKGNEFAKVDEDDTPDNQRFITFVTKTIKIVPHHFEVDLNVSNFDNNFTYLDKNLNIYSLIDLNITAQNEQNQTTKNYNTKCYAKNVDVNLTPDIFKHNETLLKNVLYKIFYVDSDSTVYKNNDINFSIDERNFTTDHNGSALVKIHINFDRNISIPEDPFEYNISRAQVNNSDVNLTYSDIEGNATFYYGNIYMIDMITSKNDFNISQKILMFDDNSSDTYKSNSDEVLLNWYQNLFNHLKDANISNFVVTKGYIYNPSDVVNSVKVKVNDINDSINLNIQRTNSNINFVVIHIIDTNASHLWYSKYGNEYNISQGSSCTNHFCFTITWPKNEQNSGVLSGNISGTKAEVNESNETKRGVKIFR